MKTLTLAIRSTLFLCGAVLIVNGASASPQNGVVVKGNGTISKPDNTSTVIRQKTQNIAINWSSFNVGKNETVEFIQPNAKSTALNRIFDQSASSIMGRISANGRVVFLNGNGILFGPDSQLNTGSLVASTLDISNEDFMSGRLRFRESDNGSGAVINQGTITASSGSVALLGNSVENSGLIVANSGSVTLASGKSATLDFDGDGLLSVAVDKSVIENAVGVSNGVLNSGEIQAGEVLLTAKSAQDVFDHVVNNTGVIRASQIDKSGGTIRLLGGDGDAVNSGTLDASGTSVKGTGGRIEVLGEEVTVASGSVLDASGEAGGGTILVGGDMYGKGRVQTAQTARVENGASLIADAKQVGDGGKVVVWSDGSTHFDGTISAKGGEQSGNGGQAEVSGKNYLDFGDNGAANLTAANGIGGMLLLDPANINIVLGNSLSDLNGDGTTGDFLTGDILKGDYPGATSVISTFRLNNLLATTSVTLEATDTINLGSLSPWTLLSYNTNTLTLKAPNVNLYGHVHGDGKLNVIASNRLYLGVNLHFTELKPISLSGVAGKGSILSGGKNFVITGVDQGTVNLVNGTLEDNGNSNANTARWKNFASIEGLTAADAKVLETQCSTCVAGAISSSNNFTFQQGGSLSGGIIGLDSQDTVINFNNTVSVLKTVELADAALSDPSLQVFSTVDTGVKLPCDQSEEEGACDSVAVASNLNMPIDEQVIAAAYLDTVL